MSYILLRLVFLVLVLLSQDPALVCCNFEFESSKIWIDESFEIPLNFPEGSSELIQDNNDWNFTSNSNKAELDNSSLVEPKESSGYSNYSEQADYSTIEQGQDPIEPGQDPIELGQDPNLVRIVDPQGYGEEVYNQLMNFLIAYGGNISSGAIFSDEEEVMEQSKNIVFNLNTWGMPSLEHYSLDVERWVNDCDAYFERLEYDIIPYSELPRYYYELLTLREQIAENLKEYYITEINSLMPGGLSITNGFLVHTEGLDINHFFLSTIRNITGNEYYSKLIEKTIADPDFADFVVLHEPELIIGPGKGEVFKTVNLLNAWIDEVIFNHFQFVSGFWRIDVEGL